MPYNTTPITPAKETTGSASLPLARVKKIIASDPDVSNCSNNAAFMITVAAEMFIQHLVEQSYNVVKSERKPRRNIQYRDVANAVARAENLEFLTDVVPKTMTWKQYKQKQA
ncbi:histone-fold-containing protein, partial [Neohortaea acidophila]